MWNPCRQYDHIKNPWIKTKWTRCAWDVQMDCGDETHHSKLKSEHLSNVCCVTMQCLSLWLAAVCKLLYKNFSASRNWHRHGLFCMLQPICWHSSTTFFFFLNPLQEEDFTYPPIFFSIITQKKTSSGARVLLCLAEEWWELSHGQRGFSSLPKSTQVFHTYFVII